MTYDELLEKITAYERRTYNSAQHDSTCVSLHPLANAFARAAMERHKPDLEGPYAVCTTCQEIYPCGTIQAIEKELK